MFIYENEKKKDKDKLLKEYADRIKSMAEKEQSDNIKED